MSPRHPNQKILNYIKDTLKKKDVIEDLNKAKMIRESVVDPDSPDSATDRDEFEKVLEDICVRHNIPVWTGSLVLERLVIEGFDTPIEKYEQIFSNCGLGVYDEDKKLTARERAWLYEVRPIKITISPYATIDDIKKYVEKNALEIKKIQASYKDNSSPIANFYTRANKKQEIYDYVFENQNVTYEELTKSTNQVFGTKYGYDTIGRMVRRENKKRGYESKKRTN